MESVVDLGSSWERTDDPTLPVVSRMIASFFGTGLILRQFRGADIGSGTVGSLFAFPLSLLALEWAGIWAQFVLVVLATLGSLIAVRPFASEEGDPGWVVVDEAAGTFLATLGVALPAAIVAWLVFRAADIFKRAFPGVAAAERLPGSLGVTADDIMAGLYGLAAGWAVQGIL